MSTIHVPDYDWNDHFTSPEEYVALGMADEGDEFEMVRITVGARTMYRVESGRPVPIALSFPDALPPLDAVEDEQ